MVAMQTQELQLCHVALVLALLGATSLPSIEGKRLALTSQSRSSATPIAASSLQTIISKPHFLQRLRACNAYTDTTPVSILLHKGRASGPVDNLTMTSLLSYKQCHDFPVKLGRGDSMEFLKNGLHLGSFSVSDIPQRDALMLLVLHRREKDSPVARFSSHIFATVPHPQVATLDVYQGSSNSHLAIRDAEEVKDDDSEEKKKAIKRLENLEFNSVVAVGSGKYDCMLLGGPTKKESTVPLVAADAESYVLMRVGTQGLPGFPEEVVLFPNPSAGLQGCVPSVLSFILVSFFLYLDM